MRVKEAAERLGVNAGQVRRFIRDGYLDATKAGGAWEIDPRSLGRARLAVVRLEAQKAKRERWEVTFLHQCRAAGLPEPEREYHFHPTRDWRADFAWPASRLLVEIEGAVWTGGRHTRGGGFSEDCEKYAEATLRGWRVLRFTPTQVKGGYALSCTIAALEQAA